MLDNIKCFQSDINQSNVVGKRQPAGVRVIMEVFQQNTELGYHRTTSSIIKHLHIEDNSRDT